jgi:hypothetical protein
LQGSEQGTTADTARLYLLINITPGTYDVTASANGLSPSNRLKEPT